LESLLGGRRPTCENDRLGLALGATGWAFLVDPFGRFLRYALLRFPFLVVLERDRVQQRQDRLVQFVRTLLHVKILWVRSSKGLVLLVRGGVLSR
jgi:hypothetical protein